MESNNSIKIEPQKTITIQECNKTDVTIYVNNLREIQEKLRQLNEIEIDSLLQIAEKEKEKLSEIFTNELNKVALEKNVVKGGISNVNSVEIGDKIHYHYYPETKLSKELTLNIPKTLPNDIVGREEDLVSLHELLSTDKKVVVVNGLGGIGKTTLVQVFLIKYYDEYEHIAWITQDSETSIATTFNNASGLIQNLGVNTINTEPDYIFKEIIRKLKNISDKPNLLIIDNAEQSLKDFKDLLPGQPHWHLLVTSREEIPGFHVKPLGFLTKEQAIELFKKHYPLKILSDADIEDLVETVDYHTLTIEILAKTATLKRYTASRLKTAIEEDLKTNIEATHNNKLRKIEKVGSYLRSVFSLSKLTENEIWFLKQFACLPPEFHSYDLLLELIVDEHSNKKEIFSETLYSISKKGWLLHNSDIYKMHRIVIDVVKKDQKITMSDINVLFDTVTRKLNKDETKDNPVDKFIWIPYGKALLENFNSDINSKVALLQNNLSLVLRDNGNYDEAKLLLERALTCFELHFGKEHPITAKAYSSLGIVYKDLGDLKNAKCFLEKAISYYERENGLEYYRTGYCYYHLSYVFQEEGDYKHAALLAQKALTSYNKNYKLDHPYIADRNSLLGMLHCKLGNFDGAKSLLEKALISNEKNFGTEHPKTAESYSNLGIVFKEIGDYKQAKALFERSLQSNLKNYGKNHPITAQSYEKLASLLKSTGDLNNLKKQFEKTKLSDGEDLNRDSIDTNTNDSNLALLLRDLGNYNDAKLLLEKKIEQDKLKFGEDHPNLAISYSQLGLVLQDQGDYNEAKLMFEKALKNYQQKFGEDHPLIASTCSNLACVLQELGDFENSKRLFQKVVKSNSKNFGKEHPATIASYINLGLVFRDLKNFGEAKMLLEKALKLNLKDFGNDHPKTAEVYYNLARIYHETGDFINAKLLLEITIKSNEKVFGKEDFRTIVSYNTLASVLYDLGDFEDSKGYYEKVIQFNELKLGKNHTNTAVTYSDLSLVLQSLGEDQQALELSGKALTILKKNLPETDPNIQIVEGNYESIRRNIK